MKKKLLIAISGVFVAASAFAVEVDFLRVGVQPLSKDTIRLRNVRSEGKSYFGDFRWQGDGLVLVAAGEEKLPMFSITQKSYVVSGGVETNLMQACMQEFGSFSRIADFQDLVGVTADNLSLETLIGMMEQSGADHFFVTYGRNLSRDGMPYFLTRSVLSEGQAVEITRLRGALGLYAAKVPVDGKAVCVHVKPEANPFFE